MNIILLFFLDLGIGGMNLTHGFEEHPIAFYLTCGGMVGCTSTFFSILYGRYRLLDSDTSEARMRHYYALKNYLSVLDEVEARLKIEGNVSNKASGNEPLNKTNTYVTIIPKKSMHPSNSVFQICHGITSGYSLKQ